MDEVVERIKDNFEEVLSNIKNACMACGRNEDEVNLVVVTKTRPPEIIEAAVQAGAVILGENYPEESKAKIICAKNAGFQVQWHMIGHVQSRKARIVAEYFDMLHSLDSIKLADKLDRILSETDKVLPVLLEFNVSGEESKFGWSAWDKDQWEGHLPMIEHLCGLTHLKICGLMTMPPLYSDPEAVRPFFKKIRDFRDYLRTKFPEQNWNELSMGTSVDYRVAIAEGATYVRVGQAILGPRAPKA